MKICQNCHVENDKNAQFCHACGEKLSEETKMSRMRVSSKNQRKNTSLIVIVVLLLAVLGMGLFLLVNVFQTNTPEIAAAPTKNTTTSSVSTASTSPDEKLSQYDEIIAEAKKLTVDEKYKESELKLASIPVSALANPEFSSIKEAVEKLSASNNENIQNKNKQTSPQESPQASNSSSGFTGDLAKWANTYMFYYSLPSQKQSRLTISANGSVTQSNYDGTQYFGTATIESATENILSYTTDELYPMDLPARKEITSNIKITIEWDNQGGTQVLYGYLSYSSRLALTDGITKNSGMNEVWITY